MRAGLAGAQMTSPSFEVASIRQDKRHPYVRRPWRPLTAATSCEKSWTCISGNRFAERVASLADLIMDSGLCRWPKKRIAPFRLTHSLLNTLRKAATGRRP